MSRRALAPRPSSLPRNPAQSRGAAHAGPDDWSTAPKPSLRFGGQAEQGLVHRTQQAMVAGAVERSAVANGKIALSCRRPPPELVITKQLMPIMSTFRRISVQRRPTSTRSGAAAASTQQ